MIICQCRHQRSIEDDDKIKLITVQSAAHFMQLKMSQFMIDDDEKMSMLWMKRPEIEHQHAMQQQFQDIKLFYQFLWS